MTFMGTFSARTIQAVENADTYAKAFAARLKKTMLKREHVAKRGGELGVDVGALKEAAGVKSISIARRYVEGKAVPRADKMKKIADWLEVNLLWLRDGIGPESGELPSLQARQEVKPYETRISNDGVNIGRSWDLLSDRHRQTIAEQIMCYMELSDRNPYSGKKGESHQMLMETFVDLKKRIQSIEFPRTRRKSDKQKK